jgi:dihydrodipicolinate reductase
MATLAVIGQGRLGKSIEASAADRFRVVSSGRNQPMPDADIVIVAVPGAEVSALMPALLNIEKPIIVASTGQAWPEHFDARLKAQGRTWIWGQNFSLSVQALRRSLQAMGQALEYTPITPAIAIVETHHVDKADIPSGTSLLLQSCMQAFRSSILSHRVGESVPMHMVHIDTGYEEIMFHHVTRNCAVYAKGILWLVDHILRGSVPRPGLVSFEEVFDDVIRTPQNPKPGSI